MKYIIVDQFQETNFVDVYVADDNKNDFLEVEQGIPLSVMTQLFSKYKLEYGASIILFNEYDENEKHVAKREISI